MDTHAHKRTHAHTHTNKHTHARSYVRTHRDTMKHRNKHIVRIQCIQCWTKIILTAMKQSLAGYYTDLEYTCRAWPTVVLCHGGGGVRITNNINFVSIHDCMCMYHVASVCADQQAGLTILFCTSRWTPFCALSKWLRGAVIFITRIQLTCLALDFTRWWSICTRVWSCDSQEWTLIPTQSCTKRLTFEDDIVTVAIFKHGYQSLQAINKEMNCFRN